MRKIYLQETLLVDKAVKLEMQEVISHKAKTISFEKVIKEAGLA